MKSLMAVLAVGAVLVLAGCQGEAPAVSPTLSDPTPAVSATPAGPTQPDQVFGGDCSALLPDATVDGYLGESAHPWSVALVDTVRIATQQLGGIVCEWDADSDLGASLWLVVLPADRIPGQASADPSCYGADTPGDYTGVCSFGFVESSIWISGVFDGPVGSINDDARAVIASLHDDFALSAAGESTPSRAAPATWNLPAACEQLSTGADVPAVLVSPGLRASSEDTAGELAAGAYAASSAAAIRCWWLQENQAQPPAGELTGFTFEAVPGAGWLEPQIQAVDGVVSLEIPGVDSAYLLPGEEAGWPTTLQLFDDGNWASMSSLNSTESVELYYAAASAIVAALGS